MALRRLVARGLMRTGSTAISAGRKVIENIQAAATPVAVMLPRWANGGASLKLRLRKPIIVVTLVRNTGCMLTRRDSAMASRLAMPPRISLNMVTRI